MTSCGTGLMVAILLWTPGLLKKPSTFKIQESMHIRERHLNKDGRPLRIQVSTKREIFKLIENYNSIVFVDEEKKCIVTACSRFSRQIFGGSSVNRGIEAGWRVFA